MRRVLLIGGLLFLNACQFFPQKEGNNRFEYCKITMKVKFLVDDEIELFYQNNAILPFDKRYSIRESVEGSDSIQEIVFNIPKAVPEKIRIDLGHNINNKEVMINEVLISDEKKEIIINSTNFNELFLKNEYIFEEDNLRFKLIPKLTEKQIRFDPYFVSSPLLIKKLVSF